MSDPLRIAVAAEGPTDALVIQAVILRWLGERQCPTQLVLCTPSKSTEAWVIAAVWPTNPLILRGNWECHEDPERQLGALPKRRRFEKAVRDYRGKQDVMTAAWPAVSANLAEAARFEREFLAALSTD